MIYKLLFDYLCDVLILRYTFYYQLLQLKMSNKCKTNNNGVY